jgi:hypothetical protein
VSEKDTLTARCVQPNIFPSQADNQAELLIKEMIGS